MCVQVSDLEVLLGVAAGSLAGADLARAQMLIEQLTGEAAGIAGVALTPTVTTEDLRGSHRAWLHLPRRPVLAVSQVQQLAAGRPPITLTDAAWSWAGGDVVRNEHGWGGEDAWWRVQYTHGLTVCPPEATAAMRVALVRLWQATMPAPGGAPTGPAAGVVTQETIGSYSYTLGTDGSLAAAAAADRGPGSFTAAEAAVFRRWRPNARSASLDGPLM